MPIVIDQFSWSLKFRVAFTMQMTFGLEAKVSQGEKVCQIRIFQRKRSN